MRSTESKPYQFSTHACRPGARAGQARGDAAEGAINPSRAPAKRSSALTRSSPRWNGRGCGSLRRWRWGGREGGLKRCSGGTLSSSPRIFTERIARTNHPSPASIDSAQASASRLKRQVWQLAPIPSPTALRYFPDVGIEVRKTVDGIGMVGKSVGLVSGQDLLDATARLREEVEGNPRIRYAVMDLSAIPEETIATESLRVLATERIESASGIMVVVVAPGEVLFGLSRMWEMLAERKGLISRVVRTQAEAITWLQGELTQRVDPFRLTE